MVRFFIAPALGSSGDDVELDLELVFDLDGASGNADRHDPGVALLDRRRSLVTPGRAGHGQRHGPRLSVDGQAAAYRPAIRTARLDRRRLEGNRRELLDV